MTLITRYLLREFLKMTAACFAGFTVLFVAVDFIERADEFLRYKAAAGEILRFYLYRLPSVFTMVSPVVVLLAVLVTVSLRARANEFTAIHAGGISLARAAAPILAGCAVVSALSFVVAENLVPAGNRGAKEIARTRVKPGKVAAQFSQNRYWIRGENAILSAQVVDPARHTLLGFRVLEIDGDFRLQRRIDARYAAVAPSGRWMLRDGSERQFADGDKDPVAAPFDAREYGFPESIQAFLDGETPPEEMTYAQLAAYIADSRAKGFDVERHETDLHAKISNPLLNVIISLIGIPLALHAPRKGGVWRSLGTGLLVGFACWVILAASLALGRKGVLPPLLAAWLPDLVFAAAGALLLRGARR